jgi:hypothetical protein
MAIFFWDQDGRNVACHPIRQTKLRIHIARLNYFGTNTDIENMLGHVIAYLFVLNQLLSMTGIFR